MYPIYLQNVSRNTQKSWKIDLRFVISVNSLARPKLRSVYKTITNCTHCDKLHALSIFRSNNAFGSVRYLNFGFCWVFWKTALMADQVSKCWSDRLFVEQSKDKGGQRKHVLHVTFGLVRSSQNIFLSFFFSNWYFHRMSRHTAESEPR